MKTFPHGRNMNFPNYLEYFPKPKSMSNIPNVNDKPATRIKAKLIKALDKAVLWDCEGDEVWLPKTTFRDNKNGTIDVQDWIYNQKFNN